MTEFFDKAKLDTLRHEKSNRIYIARDDVLIFLREDLIRCLESNANLTMTVTDYLSDLILRVEGMGPLK